MARQQLRKLAKRRGCSSILALQHRPYPHGDRSDAGPIVDGDRAYHPAPAWDAHISEDDVVDEVTAIAWIIWECSDRAPHAAVYHALRAVLRGETFESWCTPKSPSVRDLIAEGYSHASARRIARELAQGREDSFATAHYIATH